MSAYPFSQQPTFSQFKQILDNYGCEYVELKCHVDDEDWYMVPYFVRDIGGRRLTAVAIYESDERVAVSDVRRICGKLNVPTEIFGLTLTDWFDPDGFS